MKVKKELNQEDRKKIESLESYLRLMGFYLKDEIVREEKRHQINEKKEICFYKRRIYRYLYKNESKIIILRFFIYENNIYDNKIQVELMSNIYREKEFKDIDLLINWILENV